MRRNRCPRSLGLRSLALPVSPYRKARKSEHNQLPQSSPGSFCGAALQNGHMRLNVLVTGGAGYIGSHACKALTAAGYTPIAYGNLSRGNRWAVKWGPLEEGDIADSARVHVVLEKYRPAALMHFAAYAYVGESVQKPLLYYGNNFAGTAALLQAVLDSQIMPVVFSSSCASSWCSRTVFPGISVQ